MSNLLFLKESDGIPTISDMCCICNKYPAAAKCDEENCSYKDQWICEFCFNTCLESCGNRICHSCGINNDSFYCYKCSCEIPKDQNSL